MNEKELETWLSIFRRAAQISGEATSKGALTVGYLVCLLRDACADELKARKDGNEKNERNARVQKLYDELMAEGRHGHYETMYRVVQEEVERALEAALAHGPNA